jgi:hypothetical protein
MAFPTTRQRKCRRYQRNRKQKIPKNSMATENRFIRQWEKRLGRYQHAYAQAELTNIFSMQKHHHKNQINH